MCSKVLDIEMYKCGQKSQHRAATELAAFKVFLHRVHFSLDLHKLFVLLSYLAIAYTHCVCRSPMFPSYYFIEFDDYLVIQRILFLQENLHHNTYRFQNLASFALTVFTNMKC